MRGGGGEVAETLRSPSNLHESDIREQCGEEFEMNVGLGRQQAVVQGEDSAHQGMRIGLTRTLTCLMAVVAIACQSPSSSTVKATNNPASPDAIAQSGDSPTETESSNSTVYESDRLGFSFKVPNGFTIDNSLESAEIEAEYDFRGHIELWSNADYEAIQAGAYEGGTEYPPNVSITVYNNPEQRSPQDWVEGSNRFLRLGEYSTVMVAGQERSPSSLMGCTAIRRSYSLALIVKTLSSFLMLKVAKDMNRHFRKLFRLLNSSTKFVD
ncbi:MAG: hypothetical protein HC832_03550 [Leptolyngbyaceae cyanobacterium RM1_405_57]|nr:hypothetical protein [Leptolyngbyaceae cyanobacterium RM1_405_57]